MLRFLALFAAAQAQVPVPAPFFTGPWTQFGQTQSFTRTAPSAAGPGPAVRVKWVHATRDPIVASPAIANGAVVTGGYAGLLYLLNVTDGTLYNGGAPTQTGLPFVSSPAVWNPFVFYSLRDVFLAPTRTAPGRWVSRGVDGPAHRRQHQVELGRGMLAASSIVIADDGSNDYFVNNATLSKQGLVLRQGEILWSFTAPAACVSTPVVVPSLNLVLLGSRNGVVYALNDATGAVAWAFDARGDVTSTPAVDAATGRVFVTAGARAFALAGATGQQLWAFAAAPAPALRNAAPRFIQSSAVFNAARGTVVFGSDDGRVYALDAATGARAWAFATRGAVYATPALGATGDVFVGSTDGSMYALAGATGAPLWRYDAGAKIYASASIDSDSSLYFAAFDGRIIALESAAAPPPPPPPPRSPRDDHHRLLRAAAAHATSALTPASGAAVAAFTAAVVAAVAAAVSLHSKGNSVAV